MTASGTLVILTGSLSRSSIFDIMRVEPGTVARGMLSPPSLLQIYIGKKQGVSTILCQPLLLNLSAVLLTNDDYSHTYT
jgi:hypothetical protein